MFLPKKNYFKLVSVSNRVLIHLSRHVGQGYSEICPDKNVSR